MPVRPRIPAVLTGGPFNLNDALRAGLTRWHLRSPTWRRIAPGTYVWAGLAPDPMHALAAVRRRLPPNAAFSGRTAAWLHGLDVPPDDPIQVTIPPPTTVAARAGISIRRSRLDECEIVTKRGLRTTTILRALLDVGETLPLTEAVVAADMALHQRLLQTADLEAAIAARGGTRNVARLRRVIGLVEPASESPMETRLRLLLELAGLPRPKVQVDLHDRRGRFIGRADLYYPSHRLWIEYDGGTHRHTLVGDNRRQNHVQTARYQILRFTAPDVLNRRDSVVNQVRGVLTGPPTPTFGDT